MKIGGARFNFNLLLVLALGLPLLWGCQTTENKNKKQLSTFRVHIEANVDATNRTEQAVISRDPLLEVTVDKAPFLTEGEIKEAKVVEVIGGFALRVQFDRRGSLLLEEYSADNRGKHFAIYSQFVMPPEKKLNEGRWLAAPRITRRITDGVLFFTPSATREETEQIVLGLNNVAKKLETGSEF